MPPRLLAQSSPSHVVSTASRAGRVPSAGMVPYATTKAAVVGLSEALDREVVGQGVRVHALCPGVIDTAIVRTCTMRGEWVGQQQGVRELDATKGTSPDVVARAALAALPGGAAMAGQSGWPRPRARPCRRSSPAASRPACEARDVAIRASGASSGLSACRPGRPVGRAGRRQRRPRPDPLEERPYMTRTPLRALADRRSSSAVVTAPAPVPVAAPVVGQPVVSVRDLWKVYGPKAEQVPADERLRALSRRELLEQRGCTAAVRDVDFDVAAGEVFVVMGLSGSGKSTLVRCLTRLVEPSAGQVLFEGEDLLAADDKRLRELRRRKFAMVFQHFGLLPHRRVLENVAYGLEVAGTPKDQRRRRAQEVVELVGLAGYEGSYPDQLSGGMQQRVGLARALAADPDVLFLDEPFSALDPLTRRDMQDEVARLHSEVGKTMVFVTHDLNEALRLGDRILLMRDGRAVQCGTGAELVGAPADEHVRDFVREVTRADVLTLRYVMRPPAPEDRLDGPELGPDVVVREATRTVFDSDAPVKVVAGGELLGVVGQDEVLVVLADHGGRLR